MTGLMLQEETHAPDIELPGTDGDQISTYHLSTQLSSGSVLLAFYNFDFAPVCTSELCSLRDAGWFSFTDNLRVFGISTDGIFSHERFAQEYNIDFPLLADTDGSATEKYDIRYTEEGCPGVPQRSIFLIDSSQTIRYAWTTDDGWETPDLDPVQKAVEAHQEA